MLKQIKIKENVYLYDNFYKKKKREHCEHLNLSKNIYSWDNYNIYYKRKYNNI